MLAEFWYGAKEAIEIVVSTNDLSFIALKLFPFVLLLEVPFFLFIILGVLRFKIRTRYYKQPTPYYPRVSCGLLCYSEGKAIENSIRSLAEQIYAGHIQILAVIDGAITNKETTDAAKAMREVVKEYPNRSLVIAPKRQRGGRVSSLNTILALSEGEIVMALDGDTSFNNTMVRSIVPHFNDPDVVGVAGNLRVRNAKAGIVTGLQAIEYMLAINLAKIALSEYNVVNNISGAFGIFRKKFLQHIGGWDAGTAEDLDLTLRIKSYFGRYPGMRIVFEPKATGYTDAPETIRQFLDQRLRWDGDLFWLYFRKHWRTFNPKLVGIKNFLMMVWVGLLFQIVTPFLILFYISYSLFMLPASSVWTILVLTYMFYLVVTTLLYAIYIALVSDDVKYDLSFAWLVPLFPIFTFFVRIWAAVSTLTELFLYSSKYSSMAPWWVLKRNKF